MNWPIMGRLLGPRPAQEIVITRYEDNIINYQIEGKTGPVSPKDALALLNVVAQEVLKSLAAQEAPV